MGKSFGIIKKISYLCSRNNINYNDKTGNTIYPQGGCQL